MKRDELERRIDKKEEEVASLRITLAESTAYLQALRDVLKSFPPERSESDQSSDTLRAGSGMEKARVAIVAAKRPLHVDELMQKIGMTVTKETRLSFAGSLSNYVRKHKIFDRPFANTFGLLPAHRPEGYNENLTNGAHVFEDEDEPDFQVDEKF